MSKQKEEKKKPEDRIIKFGGSNALLKSFMQRPQGSKSNKGNKDAPKQSCDLKFSCCVEKSFLQYLAAGDDVPPFWHEHGAVKYPSLTAQGSRLELKDCQIKFGDLAMTELNLSGALVKSFKFEPLDHHAMDMTFTVTVVEPDDKTLLAISHANGKKAELFVSCNLGPVGATVPDDDENPYPGLALKKDEEEADTAH